MGKQEREIAPKSDREEKDKEGRKKKEIREEKRVIEKQIFFT